MSNAFIACSRLYLSIAFFAAIALTSSSAHACACGCGIFDVQTSAMLPTGEGGMAFMEYDFMNQNRNWHGASRAPDADNDDKDIKTHFFTVGAQYMFSRAWGAQVSVPYWERHFSTIDEDSGDPVSVDHGAFGDVRMKGIYSGFSPDMSSGLTFGVKLPTGDYHFRGFDRDTAIGTGSTDLLLGAYHMGNLTGMWAWFANGEWDQPLLTQSHYRPGSEVSASIGTYYEGWAIGNVKLSPVAQMIGSYRRSDSGSAAAPFDSGYQRLLLSPGVEVQAGGLRMYGGVSFPVYEHVRGSQLVASELFKFTVSHSF